MKIEELLKMNSQERDAWLTENKNNIVLAPRKLTKDIRLAFHNSMDKHRDGHEVDGSPDDQWSAMIEVIET